MKKWPAKFFAKPNTREIRRRVAKMIHPVSYLPTKTQTLPSISLQALKRTMNTPITELSPGFSQPVWGPQIGSIVGAYSREGYTSRSFDTPAIAFSTQEAALQQDEDVQLAINSLSSQVAGGGHYITTVNESLTEHFEKFSHEMEFDRFDSRLIKELLWYGNSVWKPRMGIANVQSFDDLMHIPISSFVRVWWDRQRQAYKYEFRGAEYQGYHNPGEIIHFNWNPVNASVFGTGFGVALTSQRVFDMVISGDNTQSVTLPSMIDRKYAIQFIMQMASQRYVTRNVYLAPGASEEERDDLQSFVEQLQIGQDLVSGTNLDIKELGTNTRTFNPTEFIETVSAPIMKGLNDFSGKQGSESSAQYANAESAQDEKESGLSAFTIDVKIQVTNKLFRAWYEVNPYYCQDYMAGLIPYDWKDTKFDFNFGKLEKKDIPIEHQIKLIELYQNNPILMQNTKPLIEMYKMAGTPIDDETAQNIDNMYNDPDGQMALDGLDDNDEQSTALQLPPNSDIGGGEIDPQFNNQVMGSPPMDDEIYDDMMIDVRGDSQPYRRGNQSQDWNTGRNYE